MQKNDQPFEARTEYYKIEYLDEKSHVTEKELFDTVFAKLEKYNGRLYLTELHRRKLNSAVLKMNWLYF